MPQFDTFVEQIIESIRRIRYVDVIQRRPISNARTDPHTTLFDPIKAAVLFRRTGHIEEAFWMLFLFVHFGKHRNGGWRYIRDVYGRLGGTGYWTWQNVSADPSAFRAWLAQHQAQIRRTPPPGGFGNHRKYQSLDAYSSNGTGAAVESYARWVAPPRTHQELFQEAYQQAGGQRRSAFRLLYNSMKAVTTFGRTARFDYLTMVAKVGLAPIEADSAYIQGSTGPIQGAKLLFGSNITRKDSERVLIQLGDYLQVDMQVIEDALCNWQKSPHTFRPFRG
ncbi:MAG: hypothetical protein OXE50_10525 [Chloroflexi bacterium]|nr:hypothetical protein [Chloroflexota bacterium]